MSIVHFDIYMFTPPCFSRAVVGYILLQGLQYALSAFFRNVCGLKVIVSLHSAWNRSMGIGDRKFSTWEGFQVCISCYPYTKSIAIKMHKYFLDGGHIHREPVIL
jgi:hypothetical protein